MKLYICNDVTKAKWNKKNDLQQKESSIFVKKAICNYIDEKEKKIDLFYRKNCYGKPFIEKILYKKDFSINIDIHFSLSHSQNMIMCAVATHNIGADCQYKQIKGKESFQKITKRFFTADENDFLDSISTDSTYLDDFYDIWAKKEAYIKYTGKGLAEGLHSFSVADKTNGQNDFLRDVQFYKVSYNLKDYSVFLCYNKEIKYLMNILEI